MAVKESKTIDEILYEIADSFDLRDESEITISNILYYVADPFDTHAELKDDEIMLTNDVLAKKFKDGNKLADRAYRLLRAQAEVTKEGDLENKWQLLGTLMKNIAPRIENECLSDYKKLKKEEGKHEHERDFAVGKEIIRYSKGQSNKNLWENHKFREGYYFIQKVVGEAQIVTRRIKSKERIIKKLNYKIIREFLRAEDTIRLSQKSEKFEEFIDKMEKFRGIKYVGDVIEKIKQLYERAKKSKKIEDVFDKNSVSIDDIFGIKKFTSGQDNYLNEEKHFKRGLSIYYVFREETDDPAEKYSERVIQQKWQFSTKDMPDVSVQIIFKTVRDEIFDEYVSEHNRETFERRKDNKMKGEIKKSSYSRQINDITEKTEKRLSKLVI